jgi:hypothetical protein
MSYTVSTPGAKPRPGQVSLASTLLYVGAALTLVYGVLGIINTQATSDITIDGQPAGGMAGLSGTVLIVVYVVLYGALAVGLAVLGNLVGKGRNPARIVTWVVDGLVVLCCGCGLLASVAGMAALQSMSGLDQETLDELAAATPGWLLAATTVVGLLIVLTQATVIILLALPASNDYFRAEQEVWVPPTVGGSLPYPPVAPPTGQAAPPPSGGYPSPPGTPGYPPPPDDNPQPPPPPVPPPPPTP